jgi:hypothetical protein
LIVCPSNKRAAAWLVFFFLLALAARMSWGQSQEFPALSSATSELSSYDTNALWALYFQTLTEQDALLTMDKLRWQAFESSMLAYFESLQMQMLASQRTERRASLALQAAKTALNDSESSALSSKREAEKALEMARFWKAGTFITGGAAVALAGLCWALAGK